MPGYLEGGWRDKYVILKKRQYRPEKKETHVGYAIAGRSGVVQATLPDEDATYFVLRLDQDPHARAAAETYADSVEKVNPKLAADIRRRLDDTEDKFKQYQKSLKEKK